jgi:hypothetical protein
VRSYCRAALGGEEEFGAPAGTRRVREERSPHPRPANSAQEMRRVLERSYRKLKPNWHSRHPMVKTGKERRVRRQGLSLEMKPKKESGRDRLRRQWYLGSTIGW